MGETKAQLEKRVDLADARLGAIASFTDVIRILTLPFEDIYDGVGAEAVDLLGNLGEAAAEVARALRNRDRMAAETAAGRAAMPDPRVQLSAEDAEMVVEVAVKLYLSGSRNLYRAQLAAEAEQVGQRPRAVA